MNRAFVALALTSTLVTAGAVHAAEPDPAQIKGFIVIVKPRLHEETRDLLKRTSRTLGAVSERTADAELAARYGALSAEYWTWARSESLIHASGWLVQDPDGSAWVVTSRFIAEQAEDVTLEWDKSLHHGPLKRCTVAYVDPDTDLAVIAVPRDKLPSGAVGLEPFTGQVAEGMPVWTAGFPYPEEAKTSLFRKTPAFEVTAGNVYEARHPLAGLPGAAFGILHGASLDSGGSGGPLLVEDRSAATGYRVAGVNTRPPAAPTEVATLAIPVAAAEATLAKARRAQQVREDPARLAAELNRSATMFAQELGSRSPDMEKVRDLVSYRMVAKHANKLFPILWMKQGFMEREQVRDFLEDPVGYMRLSMFDLLFKAYHPAEPGEVRLIQINEHDLAHIGRRKEVRTTFSVSGRTEEVSWTFEHGAWKISDATIPNSPVDTK